MGEARGFDDLFNPLAAWIGVASGRRAPAKGRQPASTSELRDRTSYEYGMGDSSVLHSRQSLKSSSSRRQPAAAPLTDTRAHTSFTEKGVAAGGFGSFVDHYQPPLAPQTGPRRGAAQPASVTAMRRFTSALEGGI
ncbi:MAG TPA: hypothetical protein VNI01_02120 [Elusimicrobiota bacterium]|jgi:hypothetical protein|nr:hypothetical protein [Elusimicrobiota bacterium]